MWISVFFKIFFLSIFDLYWNLCAEHLPHNAVNFSTLRFILFDWKKEEIISLHVSCDEPQALTLTLIAWRLEIDCNKEKVSYIHLLLFSFFFPPLYSSQSITLGNLLPFLCQVLVTCVRSETRRSTTTKSSVFSWQHVTPTQKSRPMLLRWSLKSTLPPPELVFLGRCVNLFDDVAKLCSIQVFDAFNNVNSAATTTKLVMVNILWKQAQESEHSSFFFSF